MIDEKYNPEHCDKCPRDCSNCMDAYKTKGGIKPIKSGTFLSRLEHDPNGYCVMRYAQRNMLDKLTELLEKQAG